MRARQPKKYMEFAMPVLENPEVIIKTTTSGLASFHQKVNTEIAEAGYETDIGVNDPMGLNVVCNSIQIYDLPVQGDKQSSIRMSVYLSEQWDQKDDFMARMAAENINVREEPMAWGSTMTHIVVTGQDNIRQFGRHLRDSFATTSHEGATIERQIVNPALLGMAIDHVNDVVAQSKQPRESLGATWATYDWNA